MSTLAAHQPQYLPWLGYFDKLDQADLFVLLDDVQFKKNEWQNRNRIKTADGWQWLTVPVLHDFGQTIAEVEIHHDAPWARKHRAALETNYSPAACYDAVMPGVSEILQRPWERLSPLNVTLVHWLAGELGIDTATVLGSEMESRDDPTLRLVDLCHAGGCDTYLSGAGAHDYLEIQPFHENGIEVVFQEFEHPAYPQLFDDFESNLSVIDLLLNCGGDSLEVIRSGRRNGRQLPGQRY